LLTKLPSQGVPVYAQEMRCFDLIAEGSAERRRDKRNLDITYDTVIKAWRGKLAAEGFEIAA
jgi:hypothetical protein